MFFLIGLAIMGGTALFLLRAVVGFANGASQNNRAAMWGWGLPAALLVALFYGGIWWGDVDAQAHPREVYTAVFGTKPPPLVTNLRAYRDDDELSPIYLQFNAPPRVVTALLRGNFTLNALAAPDEWRLQPAWFDTQITPTTRVYALNQSEFGRYILLHDPPTNRVRLYFASPRAARVAPIPTDTPFTRQARQKERERRRKARGQ